MVFEQAGLEWDASLEVKTVGLASGGGGAEACWEIWGLNSEPLTHSSLVIQNELFKIKPVFRALV